MSPNTVTYTVNLTPENADTIDAINRILLGKSYTVSAGSAAAEVAKAPASTTSNPDPAPTGMTFDDFKEAIKAAKKAHGDDFIYATFTSHGVTKGDSLPKTVSAVDPGLYEAIAVDLKIGPSEPPAQEDDDWGDEPAASVSAEAVEAAVKAYAKEHDRDKAREIMQANGAASLSKIKDCTPAQLAAMMKALV